MVLTYHLRLSSLDSLTQNAIWVYRMLKWAFYYIYPRVRFPSLLGHNTPEDSCTL
jgi:hypothetical protein